MESNTTAAMLNYPPTNRHGTTAMDNANPDNAILIPQQKEQETADRAERIQAAITTLESKIRQIMQEGEVAPGVVKSRWWRIRMIIKLMLKGATSFLINVSKNTVF
jgi:hypothetical protein